MGQRKDHRDDEMPAWVEEILAELVQCHGPLTPRQAEALRRVFPWIVAMNQHVMWDRIAPWRLSEADADDVGQQVLELWHRKLLDGFPENQRGLLTTLTDGKLKNHARGKKRREPFSAAVPSSGSEPPRTPPDLARELDREALRERARTQLSPAHRAVIELVMLERLTHQEAATELGIPLGTVKSRYYEAQRLLAEMAQILPRRRAPRERGRPLDLRRRPRARARRGDPRPDVRPEDRHARAAGARPASRPCTARRGDGGAAGGRARTHPRDARSAGDRGAPPADGARPRRAARPPPEPPVASIGCPPPVVPAPANAPALPPVVRAPDSLTGTAMALDLPASAWDELGKMPFVTPEQVPPNKKAPRTLQGLVYRTGMGNTLPLGENDLVKTLAALPFAGSKPDAVVVPFPRMSVQGYASICAELAVTPERSLAVLRRYEVPSTASLQALQEYWAKRLAADSEERATFDLRYTEYEVYARWLVASGK